MTTLQVIIPASIGLMAGLVLLRRVPILRRDSQHNSPATLRVSMIIPARNEADNLPTLLGSLAASGIAGEVIVVDDASGDGTASIAQKAGAHVLPSQPLPEGWRGKTWACWQGAAESRQETLLFLDADTYFLPEGWHRLCDAFSKLHPNSALSVLPFHRTKEWYEQLSLFFNLLMAIGAGGFGGIDKQRLFGQCMMVRRSLYESAGGHAAVRGEILENLHFAQHILRVGGKLVTVGGAGTLEMRMFPEGFSQLYSSWKKGFVNGAASSSPQVLLLSYLYLSGCSYVSLSLFLTSGPAQTAAGAMYLLYAGTLAIQSRQLGTYSRLTALLFPIPLVFYFMVFGQALLARLRGQTVLWRGRNV